MQNDEIHMKAQAEARYYLETKERERQRFMSRVLLIGVTLLFTLVFITAIAE